MRMLHIDVKWWRLPIINEIRRLWFHDTNLVIGSNYTYNTGKLRSFRRLTRGKGVFQKVKGGTVVSLPVMTSDWLFCLGIFLVRCGLIGCPVFVFFCFPPPLLALHLFGFFTKVFSFFNFTSLLFCVFPCFLLLFLPFLLSALLDFVTFCSKSLTFFLFFQDRIAPGFCFSYILNKTQTKPCIRQTD